MCGKWTPGLTLTTWPRVRGQSDRTVTPTDGKTHQQKSKLNVKAEYCLTRRWQCFVNKAPSKKKKKDICIKMQSVPGSRGEHSLLTMDHFNWPKSCTFKVHIWSVGPVPVNRDSAAKRYDVTAVERAPQRMQTMN